MLYELFLIHSEMVALFHGDVEKSQKDGALMSQVYFQFMTVVRHLTVTPQVKMEDFDQVEANYGMVPRRDYLEEEKEGVAVDYVEECRQVVSE